MNLSSISTLFSGLALTGFMALPAIEPVMDAYYEGAYEETVAYSDGFKIEVPYCLTDLEDFEFRNFSRYLPAGQEWLYAYDASMEDLSNQVSERSPICNETLKTASNNNRDRSLTP